MIIKKYSTSEWILKSTVHQKEYKKVHQIKMNTKKYIKSKWILTSTSNQNEYE